MAIFNNSPALSWIKVSGAIVTHNDMPYLVSDVETNKKYVYWNANTPYTFELSNTMMDVSISRVLVILNDFGVHTVVPSTTDNFNITFDGDSKKNTDKQIHGLHEQNKIDGEKFVAIETDINGIRQVVGEIETTTNSIIESVTNIEQKANAIELNVNKTTARLDTNNVRESVNKSIIELNASLGLFKSEINGYIRDNVISLVEKDKIDSHISILDVKKGVLYLDIDNAIKICNDNNDSSSVIYITSAKNALNDTYTLFKSTLNSIVSDLTITPTDKTLISNIFAQCSLKINELKNTLDDAILLGMGGIVSEELAKISMKSDEISLSVEDSIVESISKIEIGGVNLLNNGVQFRDTSYWEGDVINENYILNCNGIVQNTSDVKLDPEQDYVLSLSVELPLGMDVTVDNLLNYIIKYK